MTERIGLYLIVGVTMLNVGAIYKNTNELSTKVADLESMLKTSQPILQEKDVLGNPELETFYEINGQRFYLRIDGKPVEQYCR